MGGGQSNEEKEQSAKDAAHPDNVKCEHEGWDDIKDKKRSCTDCLCVLLIICAWVAMTGVGFVVTGVIKDDHLQKGNPNRLLYPIDYKGNICGRKDMESKSYGYYLPDRSAVCVKKCPNAFDGNTFICRYNLQDDVDADNTSVLGYQEMAKGGCMYEYDTVGLLQRCVPNPGSGKKNSAKQVYDSAKALNVTVSDKPYESFMTDGAGWVDTSLANVLELQGYVFGFGLGVSILVAFVYLYILRIPFLLPLIIWGMIIGIFVLLMVGSWMLWGLANTWATDDTHAKAEVVTMRVFAYIGMGITVLYVCMIIAMRKRIMMAVGIVRQACKAMAAMPFIIFVPLVQAVGIMIFLGVWLVYVLYLATSGEESSSKIEQGDASYSSTTFTYTDNTKIAFVYMIFCWFWTSEFVIAIGQMVVALCFTAWYFTRDKGKVGNATVVWSFKTVLRYHLGSCAYGSLVIAIIKTVRAIVEYIKKKAAKNHNKCMQYTMCLISCLLLCLEKIMKFINKHAYILIAIYGDSFCPACRKAFFLLLRNILRVASVNFVAMLLLFLGKIFVPVVSTFLCYVCVAYTEDPNVSGIIAPLILCFILAFCISTIFSELFGMGIETILFCYIADEEMFSLENRFASGELMSTMQETAMAAASKKVHDEAVLAEQMEEKNVGIPVAEVLDSNAKLEEQNKPGEPGVLL